MWIPLLIDFSVHLNAPMQKLHRAGVLAGADMTTEAALTKLSYLLAQKLPKDKTRTLMTANLRGELTVLESSQQQFSLRDSAFLQTIAKALCVSSSEVCTFLH